MGLVDDDAERLGAFGLRDLWFGGRWRFRLLGLGGVEQRLLDALGIAGLIANALLEALTATVLILPSWA